MFLGRKKQYVGGNDLADEATRDMFALFWEAAVLPAEKSYLTSRSET